MTFDVNFEENTETFNVEFESGSNQTAGKNGTTFFPSVKEDGTLSWTNDGGLPNPDSVNIKGENGEDGLTPYIGENGNWWIGTVDTGVKAAGTDGEDGTDGADGKTPTFKVENGELKVSYDSGATWNSLGNVQGEKGEDATVEIVEDMGTGENSDKRVMSQRATTANILAIADTVNNFDADLAGLYDRVGEIDDALAGKVTMQTKPTTYPQMYEKKMDGGLGFRDLLNDVYPPDTWDAIGHRYAVAQRDAVGALRGPDPDEGRQYTTKQFVEAKFCPKLYLHNIVVYGQGADDDGYMKSFSMSFSYITSKSDPVTHYYNVYEGLAAITNQSIWFCPTQGSVEGATIIRCNLSQGGWTFHCGYQGMIEETHYVSFNDTSTEDANGDIYDVVVKIL